MGRRGGAIDRGPGPGSHHAGRLANGRDDVVVAGAAAVVALEGVANLIVRDEVWEVHRRMARRATALSAYGSIERLEIQDKKNENEKKIWKHR